MASCLTGESVAFAHLSADVLRALAGEHDSPCLSLFMPTHRRVPGKLADLPALVAPIFAAVRERKIARELARFAEARPRGLGSDDLSDIARAAVAGRVAVLLVEKDRFEPGRFDRATGGVVPADGPAGGPPADLSRRGVGPAFGGEDLYGALAETVILHGGGILAVDRLAMPTESGVAAIYRYG